MDTKISKINMNKVIVLIGAFTVLVVLTTVINTFIKRDVSNDIANNKNEYASSNKLDVIEETSKTNEVIVYENSKEDVKVNTNTQVIPEVVKESSNIDTQAVVYFETAEEEIVQLVEEDNQNISEKVKEKFVKLVDFIFYGTEINGITFDELTEETKQKLINFLNGNNRFLDKMSEFSQEAFRERYSVLLEHADVLNEALPDKYRSGMKLIQKYAALPEWKMSTLKTGTRTVTFSFYGNFLPIDNIDATLILKNGKRNIAGETIIEYEGSILEKDCYETSAELKNTIKEYRRRTYSTTAYEKCVGTNRYVTIPATPKCTCTFEVPEGVTDEELSRIALDYSCGDINYVLYKSAVAQAENGENAEKLAEFMWNKVWDLAKDNDDSGNDIKKINYAKSILPEAWVAPNVYLSASNVKTLGIPKIMKPEFKIRDNTDMTGTVSSVSLSTRVYVDISGGTHILKPAEVQEMEATLHHVASNTMHYSQAVWSALSSDERAMMLEKYTIDMDYSEISDADKKESIDIPLLNCIDVKKIVIPLVKFCDCAC